MSNPELNDIEESCQHKNRTCMTPQMNPMTIEGKCPTRQKQHTTKFS